MISIVLLKIRASSLSYHRYINLSFIILSFLINILKFTKLFMTYVIFYDMF